MDGSCSTGAAVGIDVTPERFVDPVLREQLDVVTKIPGLYMTGQDTVLCGVTLCQVPLHRAVPNRVLPSVLRCFHAN
jgi:hypothetical protein